MHERGAAQAAAHRAAQIESAAQDQAAELARAREESSQLSVRMDEQTQTLIVGGFIATLALVLVGAGIFIDPIQTTSAGRGGFF